MKNLKHFILFPFLLATLISCSNDSNDDLTIAETKNLPANVKLIFDDNCISCHGATPAGGAQTSYTNYTQVKNNIDLIITYTESGDMPLGGPSLSTEEINLIKQWKDDGFPQN